jgi:lysophospholipase L1-like esterase
MSRGTHRPTAGSDLPTFPSARLLAEGDSWFTVNNTLLPGKPQNLLHQLRFHKATEIINLARPGDHIRRMAAIASNPALKQELSGGRRRWNGILLSGGGNDFIDEAKDILLKRTQRTANARNPEDFCDQARIRALVSEIQGSYRRIAALRDHPTGPGVRIPILTHTYDYATPRDAPARFFIRRLGPWLIQAMRQGEVPQEHWVAVADYLVDTLAEALLDLTRGPDAIRNFHVVETRKTLKPAEFGARGDSNDWLNEIHPNAAGYDKLAQLIEPVLEPLIGTV